MDQQERKREITFELKNHIGVLGVNKKGWRKELNLVAWNGNPAKYDLRDWDENHEKMGKGVTMNKDEIKALSELLEGIEL
ncbi:MAG: YdbC family protein [Anaerovoracaceae bacterium]|jgi:hypothetical protein